MVVKIPNEAITPTIPPTNFKVPNTSVAIFCQCLNKKGLPYD